MIYVGAMACPCHVRAYYNTPLHYYNFNLNKKNAINTRFFYFNIIFYYSTGGTSGALELLLLFTAGADAGTCTGAAFFSAAGFASYSAMA